MIIEKTIKFGYGTVLAHSNPLARKLTLKHIQPPKPIGNIKDEDLSNITVIEEVEFVYQKDMRKLLESLDDISEQNPFVEFRGYVLDFSKYNEKSVDVLRRGLKAIIHVSQMGLAC